jgi:hypothetical protein
MAAWGSARGVSHKGLLFDGGVTFYQTGFVKNQDENKPCKLSAAKTVALCAANELFDGIVLVVEDGYCSVQMEGFVTLPYSSTDPTLGVIKLEADGAGKVRVDATNGQERLVTDVDTTNKLVTFLLA